MTDIDTTEIRAEDEFHGGLEAWQIRELCDALDDATAAVRECKARSDLNVLRAEAAEARIAVALQQGHCVACVHEALTGDTE